MMTFRRAVHRARELKLRYRSLRTRLRVKRTARVAARLATTVLLHRGVEQVLALRLSKSHRRVIGVQILSAGRLDVSLVRPREVCRAALASNTAALVIAHYRPGGVIDPSAEDKRLAARLVQEGDLQGVELLDFVIVTDTIDVHRYYSFREAGLM